MKIGINDVKRIVKQSNELGGSSNYTPLEIELAKMVVKYRQTIGRIAGEKAKIFDNLYKVYAAIHNTKFAADLKHRHATVLAGNSKDHFKQAVKLDNELKGLIDDDAKEKL